MSSESGWEALDEAELELLKHEDLRRPEEERSEETLVEAPRSEAGTTPAGAEAPKAAEGASGEAPEQASPPEAESRSPYDRRYGPPAGWRRKLPPRDLAGLALSGGGIRSATFNLGLLQRLHREKLLESFDYLSTVSGGGYVGGFWSAWKSRSARSRDEVFPGDGGTSGQRPEPGEIRHLREFSNFLRPRLRLLSFETGRIVATLAGGILPSITVALAVIVLALLIWWFLHLSLTAETHGRWLAEGLVPGLVLAVLTLLVQWFFERVWRGKAEEPEARASVTYWTWAVVASVLAGLFWWLLWQVALPPRLLITPLAPEDLSMGAATALPPATAWVGAVMILVAGRSLFSMRSYPPQGRFRQGALDRALARTFLCAVTWVVVGTLWLVGQLLAFGGVDAVLAAVGVGGASGGAFVWMRRVLVAQASRQSGGRLRVRAGPRLFQALAYLTLGAVIAVMAALLVLLHDAFGFPGMGWAAGAALLVLGLSLVFNPHEVGLHGFYRDRLVRAYLGASNLDAPTRATTICSEDDVPLTCLPKKPLHLVCCAANDLFGDPLGTLHRGAESAVLSRQGFQVGDRWKPWASHQKACQKDSQKGSQLRSPTLGDAMTASAAAFNSHMGQVSMRLGQAATFLLTALGLRLGLWIENPERGEPGSKKPSGYLILQELLGWSRADARWIHLSDGAHYENLAFYELVRRHCRYILLCDCGADPDRTFDDFGNAVRRVREDFGVEIRIDISPLQPGADGKPRQHVVAGDIVYPPQEPDGPKDAGILLYVKPTLTGDEPPDVTQYARRNERFPHETTLDQFYDEAQWESYRRLGEHAAEQALASISKAARSSKGAVSLARSFLYARYYWPPLPAEEPLLRELDAEWARLERRVEKKELEPLRRELLRPEAARKSKRVSRRVREEALAAALPVVRDAVRIMEAVYLRTGFGHEPERSPSHRRYMGWLNRFGVWASAPTFRAWWPWIEPFQTRDFVTFMHKTFGKLEEESFAGTARDSKSEGKGRAGGAQRKARCKVKKLSKNDRGYARLRWETRLKKDEKLEAKKQQKTGRNRLYGFFLRPAGEKAQEINVGVVEVREENGTAGWNASDFYVAEGLWGLGIGEAFLGELVVTLEKNRNLNRARVHLDDEMPSAYKDALYTGAGFRRDPGPNHSLCFVRDLRGALVFLQSSNDG